MIVKVLSNDGYASLVEYVDNDVLMRKIVPSDAIRGIEIDDEDIEIGIQYGDIDIEDVHNITSEVIVNILHRNNIYYREDAKRSPKQLNGAISKVVRQVLMNIIGD